MCVRVSLVVLPDLRLAIGGSDVSEVLLFSEGIPRRRRLTTLAAAVRSKCVRTEMAMTKCLNEKIYF